MQQLIIYHNGECSKSKGALELLQDAGVPFDVRWYLAEPLTRAELQALLEKLHLPAEAVVRKGEPVYKELYEGKALTEAQWIDALCAHPVLLERPIVADEHSAIVARPPEKALEFIKK